MDIPSWSFTAVGQAILLKTPSDVRDTTEKCEYVNNTPPNLPIPIPVQIPVQVESNIFDLISYDNPFLTWILDIFT
jgi:hypothetical protein